MVVITGLGLVSPHGAEPAAAFDALMRGASAVQPVCPDLAKPAAGATVQFDASRWFTKLQLPGVDRVSQLAVAAASLAAQDAGARSTGRAVCVEPGARKRRARARLARGDQQLVCVRRQQRRVGVQAGVNNEGMGSHTLEGRNAMN